MDDLSADRPNALTVPDTAVGTAFARAQESARPRALFRDPFAAALAGTRGREVAEAMGNGGWAVTVRTRVLDEMLLQVIREQSAGAVLNLGAGLDARPYRLGLPAELQWIEVDAPSTIEYKQRVLAGHEPRCQLERHSGDLADRSDRARILTLTGSKSTLILTEGVLHYLTEHAVKELAAEALTHTQLKWWLIDVAHPRTVQWGRRRTSAVDLWRFTPEEGAEFFRPLGWETKEVRSGWLEARRLHRQSMTMRLAWAFSPRSRRSQFEALWTYAWLARSPVAP